MTPRKATRTQACSAAEARSRLDHARKFLEVAELVAGDVHADDAEYSSASAALAVLAGIAATDAACCKALVAARAAKIIARPRRSSRRSSPTASRPPARFVVC